MIRLHALHRRSAGTNALVVLRDTRWEDSRQIIATIEVDLSAGTHVENVVDHLTTNSITSIPGEIRSIEELEGMSWNLKLPEQTSGEKWSTLGEPSGKWDYYIRYDAPLNTTPIEEVAATGRGEEFSDDEVTLGKVTILNEVEEESDWDDDERSDPGLWLDVISRWESITINRLNSQTWSDNKAKLAFVENLFGESEKLMWQQWRTAYPGAYSALETIADDPQNITSQVRQLIIMEDPYRGSTDEQDRAYRDLDRITCKETKNFWSFLEDFRQLAIKSGKLYFSSTTEKLFAKLPPSLSKKIEESIMVQDTPIEEAAFMAIEESDDEQDIEEDYDSHHAFMFHPGPPTKIADMVQSVGSWKPDKELPTQSKSCEHDWKENAVTNYTICYYCGILTTDMDQAKEYYESKIAIKEKEELWQTERSLLVRDLTDALKIIDQLKAEQMKLKEEKDEEIRRLKAQLQEKTDKEIKVQFSKEEFPPLGNSHIARPFMEAEAHYSGSTTTTPKIRKITNQLYNVKVEFEIPNCPMFGTTAIIDTRASSCCINKKVIPKEALEPLTQTVFFNGLNSRQQPTHKIKQGYFLIEGNKFKIPLIYAFDMKENNGIEMLIGANFLRSMRGGIRIEGETK
nr:RNA-directed DNA polymerase [Tanacetum cinerariifolium]